MSGGSLRWEEGMKASYVYLWEYLVAPDHVDAFMRTYGPAGELPSAGAEPR
jgi:hypothetical protein